MLIGKFSNCSTVALRRPEKIFSYLCKKVNDLFVDRNVNVVTCSTKKIMIFLQPLRVTKFPLRGNGEEEETKLTELAKLAALRPRSYRLSYALRSDDRLLMLTICGIVELSDNSE